MAALRRRETYSAEKSGSVELRETYISWVFLVADRAYKLKKPLVLPYLDYGTPARRRRLCLEEVRLNRRLAPYIYIGVRGVALQADGTARLLDEQDPSAIDYLVEMRRYEERETLAAKLAANELDDAEIDAVAATLAALPRRGEADLSLPRARCSPPSVALSETPTSWAPPHDGVNCSAGSSRLRTSRTRS